MVVVRTAAMLNYSSKGQDYAGEQGRLKLPGDNGPDGIFGASWGDGEPEQDVGQVDDPDGLFVAVWVKKKPGGKRNTNAVEVETITEHQLPDSELLDLEGLDRATEGETKLGMTGERRTSRAESGKRLNPQKRSRAKWGRPSRFPPRHVLAQQCTPGQASMGQLKGY